MKQTYPVILTPDDSGYLVYFPDFNCNTHGNDLTEAIEMARDAISLLGISMEDDGEPLPVPTPIKEVKADSSDIVTLVDVDFAEYRRKIDQKVVKKNCTLPSWLCYEAEKANLNFSQVLQAALKRELKISE